MKIKNVFNTDGWTNLLSSLGGGKDKTTNTTHGTGQLLGQTDFESLYRFTGFAKKVIDIPAYEMTREWVNFTNDTDNKLQTAMSSIKAKKHIHKAIKWGNLYGGAICIMGIDDGGALDQPVNEQNIRNVAWLRVYDRFQVSWTTADIDINPDSPFFELPEFYTVNAYNSGTHFRVHASRILRLDGADIPERSRARNNGWGDSTLQAVYDELRHFGIVQQSCVSIVEDFVQTILNIENLTEMLSSGQEKVIKQRLDILDMSRSINNTVLLDGDEKFSKQASSVTGLEGLMGQFALALSGVTGIPITKLFGQAPAGLNATGESDIRNFYDEIKSKQEDTMLPMLQTLSRYIMLSRDMGFKGKVDEEIEIEFNPLWQLTDVQDAEWKYKIAQTDEIYIRSAVVAPQEVAVSRFANGFNPDTEIDVENRPIEPDVDEPTDTEK